MFENNHGFELWQVGLTYIGIALGMLIAIGTEPLFRKHYEQLVQVREHSGGVPGGAEPEVRILRPLFLHMRPFATLVYSRSNPPTTRVWVEPLGVYVD